MGFNDYTLIKPLGSGSFGTAHLAKKNDTGNQVVVKEKRLNKHNFKPKIWFFPESFVTTLKKQILVTDLNTAKRNKVFEEFRLLACLKDISIVQ